MKLYIFAITLLFSFISAAHAGALEKKGKWTFYYGYNRATYTNSDYHLTGNNYDFTLTDVVAHDGQSDLGLDPYLIPWKWSIPQNNIRFSYFLTDTLAISFGNDHMKYLMDSYQTVGFEGSISTGGSFDRSGPGTQNIDPSFLLFEHTDGLNFVSVELEHFVPLWSNPKNTSALSFYWGPGIAFMLPRTNAQLFGQERSDEFHISGYGYSMKVGLEYIFMEDYFLRLAAKYGHINMDKAWTTASSSDRLSHRFDFRELFLVVGLYF